MDFLVIDNFSEFSPVFVILMAILLVLAIFSFGYSFISSSGTGSTFILISIFSLGLCYFTLTLQQKFIEEDHRLSALKQEGIDAYLIIEDAFNDKKFSDEELAIFSKLDEQYDVNILTSVVKLSESKSSKSALDEYEENMNLLKKEIYD